MSSTCRDGLYRVANGSCVWCPLGAVGSAAPRLSLSSCRCVTTREIRNGLCALLYPNYGIPTFTPSSASISTMLPNVILRPEMIAEDGVYLGSFAIGALPAVLSSADQFLLNPTLNVVWSCAHGKDLTTLVTRLDPATATIGLWATSTVIFGGESCTVNASVSQPSRLLSPILTIPLCLWWQAASLSPNQFNLRNGTLIAPSQGNHIASEVTIRTSDYELLPSLLASRLFALIVTSRYSVDNRTSLDATSSGLHVLNESHVHTLVASMSEAQSLSTIQLRISAERLDNRSLWVNETSTSTGSFTGLPVPQLLLEGAYAKLWLSCSVYTKQNGSKTNHANAMKQWLWPSESVSLLIVSKAYAESVLDVQPNEAAIGMQHPALLVPLVLISTALGTALFFGTKGCRRTMLGSTSTTGDGQGGSRSSSSNSQSSSSDKSDHGAEREPFGHRQQSPAGSSGRRSAASYSNSSGSTPHSNATSHHRQTNTPQSYTSEEQRAAQQQQAAPLQPTVSSPMRTSQQQQEQQHQSSANSSDPQQRSVKPWERSVPNAELHRPYKEAAPLPPPRR